jgi:exo-1,4-beta-D-glucosaminidase
MNPSFNQYHANYEPGHTGYSFGTLFNLDAAIAARYGSWTSLDQYVEEAQLQNYEATRSQFEAFIDHSTKAPTPATGTVYWQLNKGWPTLLWDLYNHDYDQAGAYFGAKVANRDLHVLYAYDTGSVTIDNLSREPRSGLSVISKVYDLNGNVLDDQVAGRLALPRRGVRTGVVTPKVPAATTPPTPAKTSFLELTLKAKGRVIDRNVYWLSSQPDVVDWPATQGIPQATMTQYANLQALQALQGLPSAQLRVQSSSRSGAGGGTTVTSVTITNKSRTPTVAFFLRADLRRGRANATEETGDNEVRPLTWSDNDITLWPGESQTLTATYKTSLLQGSKPLVSVFGWNAPRFLVPASPRR